MLGLGGVDGGVRHCSTPVLPELVEGLSLLLQQRKRQPFDKLREDGGC
jgi:hypothetical protein